MRQLRKRKLLHNLPYNARKSHPEGLVMSTAAIVRHRPFKRNYVTSGESFLVVRAGMLGSTASRCHRISDFPAQIPSSACQVFLRLHRQRLGPGIRSGNDVGIGAGLRFRIGFRLRLRVGFDGRSSQGESLRFGIHRLFSDASNSVGFAIRIFNL